MALPLQRRGHCIALPLQRGGTAKAQAGGGMGVPFHPLLCKEGRGEVEKGRKLHGAHTRA